MTKEAPRNHGQEPKAVQMPSREEMLQRLQDTGLYGVTPQTDAFYHRFVDQVAGSEIVGIGLNMAWELAGYDTLRPYPAMVRAAVDLGFNRIIDAVTPDAEVADEAKAFRQKILDEMREQAEKDKRPAVEHPSTNFELYVATRRIGDIVHEVAREVSTKKDSLWIEDRRNETANPYYNQTESGLFLDYSYGLPHSVWTPWGEWGFRGSASSVYETVRRLTEGVMERLDVTEHRPQIDNEQGSFGPTYAVRKVEGIELPEPVIRPRNAYLAYEDAKNAWKSFTDQYKHKQQKAQEPRK